MPPERVYCWRRLDAPGLELLRVAPASHGVDVRSDLIHFGEEPFALRYRWMLDEDWSTLSLELHVRGKEPRTLAIERIGDSAWLVDGRIRSNLDACEEIDLAATPFCNTLALRRFAHQPGGAGTLTALYVSFPDLDLAPSPQRYERLGTHSFKYVDLGAQRGFEATLEIDDDGIVRRYEGLFELLGGAATSTLQKVIE
jgi:hypothetical protein